MGVCKRLSAITSWVITIAAISTLFSIGAYALDSTTTVLPVLRYGERSFPSIRALVTCDSAVLLTTMDDIFITTNGGGSWKELVAPLPHKSVIDVYPTSDTVYVLTANGAIHRTGNDGLTWGLTKRFKQGTVNRLRANERSVEAELQTNPQLTVNTAVGAYVVSDSTLFVTLRSGVGYTITSSAIRDASCIATNDTVVFIGRGRMPILAIQLASSQIQELDMGHLLQEYISAVQVHNQFLYVGVIAGQGGLYKKPIVGTRWENVNIDRNTESVDVQCIIAGPKGLYIGFREHGIAFIPNGSHLAYPIHEGLSGAVAQTMDAYEGGFLLTARLRGLVRVRDCGNQVDRYSSSIPYSGEYITGVSGKTVVVGLHEGIVLRSQDDGISWDTVALRFPSSAINTIRGYDSAIFICTNDGVWQSSDKGMTWHRYFTSLPQQNIQDVHQLSKGWLVRANEESYFCREDESYITFTPLGDFEHKPHILDAQEYNGTIYAVGYPGVFISKDMGASWKTYSIADNPIVRTVSVDGRLIYVTGLRGQIYYIDIEKLHDL